jgi:hypothetical protein
MRYLLVKKIIYPSLIFILIVLIVGITSAVSGPGKDSPVEWGPGITKVAGNGTTGAYVYNWTDYYGMYECSPGCTCMGERNALNQGRVPCYRYSNMSGPTRVICDINQLGENMYCYSDTIPATTTLPTTLGRTLTPTPSLTSASPTTTPDNGNAVVLSGCGPDCRCILPDAGGSLGLPLCGGSPVLCNYDVSGKGMYCYALSQQTALPTTSGTSGNAPALTSCSGDCTCLDPATANQVGLTLCGGTPALCSYDSNRNPMYCYNRAGVSPADAPGYTSSEAGIPLGIFTIIGAVAGTAMMYGFYFLKKN